MDTKQEESTLQFEASVSSSRIVAFTIIGLGILFAALLGLILARTVTAPTVAIADFAKRLANGELKATISMPRKDELGTLVSSLQHMVGNINAMVQTAEEKTKESEESSKKALEAMRKAEAAQKAVEEARREGMLAAARWLEQVVSVISTASEDIAVRVEQSERGSHHHASRVGETAAAVEEMTSTVLEVARNAGAASEMSNQTKDKASEGVGVVQSAVEEIRNVQTASLAMERGYGDSVRAG